MKNMNLKKKLNKGFSLIEMLVVIAIIGVIAAIAIPNIGSLTDSAKIARSQRNAQNIVSTYQAASAAGATFAATTKSAVTTDLKAGVSPADGAFAGKVFQIPGLAAEDETAALAYIDDASGVPVYDKAGGH